MTDTGIVAFLNARIDEDEAMARATGVVFTLPEDERALCWTGSDNGYEDGGEVTDGRGEQVVYDEGRPNTAQALHIARHDPARILREVEVKRKRLTLYLDAKETLAAALKKAPPEDDPATAHSYVRERINVNQASGRFTALEMSVRLDATVYSDHPDFRQEWAL